MNTALKEICELRQEKTFNVDLQNRNRYCVVIKKSRTRIASVPRFTVPRTANWFAVNLTRKGKVLCSSGATDGSLRIGET